MSKEKITKGRAAQKDPIRVNEEQKLYVISCGEGYTCLGFDYADSKARAIALELKRPDLVPTAPLGTIEHYGNYQTAVVAALAHFTETGYGLKCGLTPQLIGLEGKRVEVVNTLGNTERFYVGKSNGWLPCHLVLKQRRSKDGWAVCGAPFKSVKVLS